MHAMKSRQQYEQQQQLQRIEKKASARSGHGNGSILPSIVHQPAGIPSLNDEDYKENNVSVAATGNENQIRKTQQKYLKQHQRKIKGVDHIPDLVNGVNGTSSAAASSTSTAAMVVNSSSSGSNATASCNAIAPSTAAVTIEQPPPPSQQQQEKQP